MAQHKQQNPKPGVQDVTPALIADLQARSDAGLVTYGRRLQTFNGRNALQDALEESLDLCQYLKQAILERESMRYRRVKIVSPAICYVCRCLVEAAEGRPVEVILDDDQDEGIVALFCGLDCCNLQEDDLGRLVEERPRVRDEAPVPEEVRYHVDAGPWVKSNGGLSSILRSCAVCGQSYDPTWASGRRGCRGR